MKLHMRGVALVTELLDAADQVDRMTPAELKALLRQAALVLGEVLARDVPAGREKTEALASQGSCSTELATR